MYQLFIDESGSNTLRSATSIPNHFLIGGVLVHRSGRDFIKIRGDQIKFKYWGRTDITFHATDIRRLTGDFSIFQDVFDPISGARLIDNSRLKDDFYEDFLEYVEKASFKFICVCVNKDNLIAMDATLNYAVTQKWIKPIMASEKGLTRNVFEEVTKMFICYLNKKKKSSGQIVIEAANLNQDGDFLAIYNDFMFKGIPSMRMNPAQVRDKLTCISFATKNNRDHETQLADIGSYFIGLKARHDDHMPGIDPLTPFEQKMINVYENKKSFTDKCDAALRKSVRRL